MKKNFIIFGSRDWENNWQTQHRLVNSLSKKNRVLYIENTGVRSVKINDFPRIIQRIKNWRKSIRGFRKINENLTIFSPLVFPFPYSKIFQFINRILFIKILESWIIKNNFSNINLISFLATPLINDTINRFNFFIKIYYIGDNHSLIAKNINFELSEKIVSKNSDAIFSTSQKLLEKYIKMNSKTFKFPAGVEIEKFKVNKKILNKNFLKKIKKPIVGFVGSLNEKIDTELVEKITSDLNNYHFVFIGENDENRFDLKKLSAKKNISFIGKKKHSELKNYMKDFDCAIIPYVKNEFTDAVYPSKLNEYLAMGLPVVSTDFYEMKFYNKENKNIISTARSSKEFVSFIKKSIAENKKEHKKIRKKIAFNNSWKMRFNKIEKVINNLNLKNMDKKFEWEKSFELEFRKIQKRLRNFLLFGFAVIFLIFISPLPYYFSKSLVLNEEPIKSDLIVGISGYGQANYINISYQQRAIDIFYYYKNGYGKKIYLSGRKQIFEEIFLMKNILLSFGIPEDKIVINNLSTKSTLDEVINLNNFLVKNNYNQVNIITSPLHQKRFELILNKINPKNKHRIVKSNVNIDEQKWFYPLETLKVAIYEYFSIIYNSIRILFIKK